MSVSSSLSSITNVTWFKSLKPSSSSSSSLSTNVFILKKTIWERCFNQLMFLSRRFEPEWMSACRFIAFSLPKRKKPDGLWWHWLPARAVTSSLPLPRRSVKGFKYQHIMRIFAVLPGCPSWQDCLWPRPSPYRWPPGETLGACPQGNGDGTRPKGLGHPAEGQGVNCPPLSPSRLRSSSGVKVTPHLIQIFLAPCCPNLDGFHWTNLEYSRKF